MTKEQDNELYEKLCELDGERIVGLFLDFHGHQLLTDEFAEFCVDEGEIELSWIEN